MIQKIKHTITSKPLWLKREDCVQYAGCIFGTAWICILVKHCVFKSARMSVVCYSRIRAMWLALGYSIGQRHVSRITEGVTSLGARIKNKHKNPEWSISGAVLRPLLCPQSSHGRPDSCIAHKPNSTKLASLRSSPKQRTFRDWQRS